MKRIDWFERIWLIVFYTLFLLTVVIGLLWAGEYRTDEDDRDQLTLAIARCYGLSRNQAILLFAIRDHEAGEPAEKEFGIEYQKEKIKDPLERYCRYACKTAWAIKRFCRDDHEEPWIETIQKFNHGFGNGKKRYSGWAEDKKWWIGVIRKMKEYRNLKYPE